MLSPLAQGGYGLLKCGFILRLTTPMLGNELRVPRWEDQEVKSFKARPVHLLSFPSRVISNYQASEGVLFHRMPTEGSLISTPTEGNVNPWQKITPNGKPLSINYQPYSPQPCNVSRNLSFVDLRFQTHTSEIFFTSLTFLFANIKI